MEQSFVNPQSRFIINHFLDNLINDLKKYAMKKDIIDRMNRLNICPQSSSPNLLLLLFNIGKNLVSSSSQNLVTPTWLSDELQQHFVDYHDNGHNLKPCTTTEHSPSICQVCAKINISERIHEMITHTARVCARAANTVSNREIDKRLEDHHQDSSVKSAIRYITGKTNLFQNWPMALIADISVVMYFVMQMSISLLGSDDEQFAAIKQNLIILSQQN